MAIDKITTPAVTDDSVTLAKMAPGTDGNIISYDASGNPVAVATGSAGQVLTSAGAGAPPTFAAVAANAGTLSFQARISGNLSVSATTQTELVYNAENTDSDSKYNVSTGRYTPGVAGTYFVSASVTFAPGSNVGVGASGYLKIRANGTGTEFGQTSNQGSGDSNDEAWNANAVITLGSSDYISVWWYHTSTAGSMLSDQSWFSGFRIA